MNVYLGCPIWSFKGWVGNFYPRGTKPAEFLREYARRLTTIEGNTTFYAVPAQKTVEQWASETPETFRFCPKIPKAISHNGSLVPQIERALEFIQVMSPLGTRLGPLFLQLPPGYSPRQFDDLKAFLSAWPRRFRLAVEVRHPDWFEAPHHNQLNQLLMDHDMARVVIDTRPIRSLDGDKLLAGSAYQSLLEARRNKPDVPVFQERTADFLFLRFIGHPELKQDLPLISEWANYFVPQLKSGADVFTFCHSPDNLIAPTLCRHFHERLALGISIPPLPWDEQSSDSFEQGQLF